MKNIADLGGRALLSGMFIVSGIGKIGNLEGLGAYMSSAGVPAILAPAVMLFEIAAGLAVLAGFQTRIAALALAGFCILSALLFHFDFADQAQSIQFMKNFTIAGGFLILSIYGAGAFSIDAQLAKSGANNV